MMIKRIGQTNAQWLEFALNSSVSATTGFAPFELNQGYMPQIGMPTAFDTTFKGVKQFVLQVKWDLMAAHDAIITNRIQCHIPLQWLVNM